MEEVSKAVLLNINNDICNNYHLLDFVGAGLDEAVQD